MATGEVSSSGFVSWYKYLRIQCKKSLLDSLVVAFVNRKLVQTEATQYMLSQLSWNSKPVSKDITSRTAQVHDDLTGLGRKNNQYSNPRSADSESEDVSPETDGAPTNIEDETSRFEEESLQVDPVQESQPSGSPEMLGTEEGEGVSEARTVVLDATEQEQKSEESYRSQLKSKLNSEMTRIDEENMPLLPEKQFVYKLRNHCTCQAHLDKHIEDALEEDVSQEKIDQTVKEERAIALAVSAMRFMKAQEPDLAGESLVQKAWQGFASGGVHLSLDLPLKSQKTIQDMSSGECLHALAFLDMEKGKANEIAQMVREKLETWYRDGVNEGEHPLL